MNFIVPGSQSCIGPCCSERDIVVSISGISLIDGPDAEVSGCTVDVMNEMNAVLAADMTLSFQGVFGGECQWLLSYPPPSRVNSTRSRETEHGTVEHGLLLGVGQQEGVTEKTASSIQGTDRQQKRYQLRNIGIALWMRFVNSENRKAN